MHPLEQQAWKSLQQVIDPEIGESIVELGLVYRVEAEESTLRIDLTMTSPACPMGEMIIDDIDRCLTRDLPDSVEIRLRLVWDPPWHPGLIQPAAKARLGWS